MGQYLPLLIAIASAILLVNALGLGNVLGPPRPVAKRFLTGREAAMLHALERALPHCRIHAMGALLRVPTNPMRKGRLSDRNAFSQKIVDFVAQDRSTGDILALMEVDDRSHNILKDRARDQMTGSAGYRTIRIPGRTQPDFHDVLGDRRDAESPLPAITHPPRGSMIMRYEDGLMGVEPAGSLTDADAARSAPRPSIVSDADLADDFRARSYDLMSKHPIAAAHQVLAAASIAPECAAEQDVADEFSYVIVDFAQQLAIIHRRAVARRADEARSCGYGI